MDANDIKYHWDIDFQSNFILDYPEDKRPFIALAGGILHEDLYGDYRELMNDEAAIELVRKKDFKNRDQGFSINRAIRDDNLKIVKVFDKKQKKIMSAMPDVVDYRKDLIIDLKTYYMKDTAPPDKGGIFITADDSSSSMSSKDQTQEDNEIPNGYEDAWVEIKQKIENELYKKYKSQFQRYHEAYCEATGRVPKLNIYVVMYMAKGTFYHDEEYGGLRKEEPEGFSSDP